MKLKKDEVTRIQRILECLADSHISQVMRSDFSKDLRELKKDLVQEGWLAYLEAISGNVETEKLKPHPSIQSLCPQDTPSNVILALSYATSRMRAFRWREELAL
jgi:hypothetical protein